MARVRFHADYDHHVSRQALVAYKAGHELTVPRAHAEAAIAAGRAIEIDVPARKTRSPPPDLSTLTNADIWVEAEVVAVSKPEQDDG